MYHDDLKNVIDVIQHRNLSTNFKWIENSNGNIFSLKKKTVKKAHEEKILLVVSI